MTRPLTHIDIAMSAFNQERILPRILKGIFDNTVTPFNLILVLDGCTDRSKEVAHAYINAHRPPLLSEVLVAEAPNVFETKANNACFKLAKSRYLISIQDDMEILEKGWDVRLTYPLRRFNDVIAVTARTAHDIAEMSSERETYTNAASRETFSLSRDTFAVRDVINRGPIAYDMDKLAAIGHLDEAFAPAVLDDADLSIRSWKEKRWRVGSYWIAYRSDASWSKSKAADSSMKLSSSTIKNRALLALRHSDYLSGGKHSENIQIDRAEVDYPAHARTRSLASALPVDIFTFALFGAAKIGRVARTAKRIVKRLLRISK